MQAEIHPILCSNNAGGQENERYVMHRLTELVWPKSMWIKDKVLTPGGKLVGMHLLMVPETL